MNGEQVIKSMNNAWQAMARSYRNNPDESVSLAMNRLSQIIGKVTADYRKQKAKCEDSEISIDEFVRFFNGAEGES